MPKFDGSPYTQLSTPARGDIQGVIKDISEANPSLQTKFATQEDLHKYGAWASKVRTVTASGTVSLLDTDPMYVEIDPNGSDRDVSLPAKSDDNHGYYILHAGSANTLTIKRSGGVEIAEVEAGDVVYVMPSAAEDFHALTGGGGGGGLTNSIASVTTSNVTAVAGTRHILDIGGMTANRNFILPAGTAGQEIELVISTGDDAYHLIVKGDTGITINGGSAAGEWDRTQAKNDRVRFVATSSSNWQTIGEFESRKVLPSFEARQTSAHSVNNTTNTAIICNSEDKDTGGYYDTYLNHMTQPDSIVPDPHNSQDYDRYSYVRNNPLRYTDPSGHLCVDENTWGYCGDKLPAPQNVKAKDRSKYIKDVSRKYGIHLSPTDFWGYSDTKTRRLGEYDQREEAPYAFSPNGSRSDDYYNDDNEFIETPDQQVTVFLRTFEECESDNCVAGVLAHEATHSWMEWLIDNKSSLPRTDLVPVEEVLADKVALEVSPSNSIIIGKGVNEQHFSTCSAYTQSNCSNPAQTLYDYYQIEDIFSIANFVYGR